MKNCFKCGELKPLERFYRHSRMGDGHLNKCIDCTIKDVREHYGRTRTKRLEYERERAKRPERQRQLCKASQRRKELHPEQRAAHVAVGNALSRGDLVKGPCEVCGTTEKVQAHHDDYSEPLQVRWLCVMDHKRLHHHTPF
jgi:hypothetical protein